ncbi:carbamate kinase [Myxococcota bacterium]|nr:carbamate kinase [Myxococcota bacterium]
MSTRAVTVVAFGGNAMMKKGESGAPEQQVRNAYVACAPLAGLVARGARLVLVHGNGPQVGRELDRGFAARGAVPPVPLDVCVAATQGTMGYFIELAMRRALRDRNVEAKVATLATIVRVDADDPAFARPDKPIGPFYSVEEAERVAVERGARFTDDAGRGHRQVVPSPLPREVLDLGAVAALVDAGYLVIAGGGGGIPVVRRSDGLLHGVEAVIDKDHTAAVLAAALGARELVDLTAVDYVYRDFGKPGQRAIREMTVDEARRMFAEGQFPPGNMGPKVAAACKFLENGGDSVLISSMEHLALALAGEVGTRITGGRR